MSLELVSNPAVIAQESPEKISRLVGTDCPVEFVFSRNDGIATSVEDASGSLRINGTINAFANDRIGIYDPVFNRMIEGKINTNPTAGIYITNIPWVARYTVDLAGTYVINYTKLQGVYLEYRIKANDEYLPTTFNAQADYKGLMVADVSGVLRQLVTGEKSGDYTAGCVHEPNQSGKFELEYRERYSGDTNEWVAEGNTWYYVKATRTKEQGCNLVEYFNADGVEGKFFNEFAIPNWNIGVPMDVGFWFSPDATAASAVIKEKDLAGNVLDTHNISCPTAGKGYLNSIRVNLSEMQANTRRLGLTVNFTW